MSTVDARDITKPTDDDFVPQATAELRALKVLVAAIEEALQAEDLDIRADVAALLTMKLSVPLANLALPALVANGALIVNPAGNGLVWDADYGEFVANAAALTSAVEDATAAAAAAQLAADAAQEAVDTGAVNKATTTEQIMNADLTIQQDSARIRLQRDTEPLKTFSIEISSTKAQLYAQGGITAEVVGDLTVTGLLSTANHNVSGELSLANAGALFTAVSGSEIDVQSGALLRVRDDPTIDEGAANKRYVDGRISVVSLRLVTSQSAGASVLFDTAYRNDGEYWNSGTKLVNAPNKYGTVVANVCASNGSAFVISRIFTLAIAGVPRSVARVDIPAGAQREVNLSFTGPLSGLVSVTVNSMSDVTFMGSNSGPTTTNLGMIVYE